MPGNRLSAGRTFSALAASLDLGCDGRPTRDPPQDGFLSLDRAKFAASFAADVKPDQAAVMAESQVPWGLDALNGEVTVPAWKSKPSWYLVATNDKMIPVGVQRMMAKRAGATTVDQAGSHAVYVSKPHAVAAVIEQAAKGVSEKCK